MSQGRRSIFVSRITWNADVGDLAFCLVLTGSKEGLLGGGEGSQVGCFSGERENRRN